MVADVLYNGKPWVDLSKEELMQCLKALVCVSMHQSSAEEVCRHVFRVLKMDASVPADDRVSMQKRAVRKYHAHGGLTRW